MKILDGRKLNHEALEAIRIRAVLQVERGESPETVIKSLGMDRSCIYKWIAKYREGGLKALKAKKLLGRPLTLKGPQLRWVYKTITNKNPIQLQFPYALWTREMVKELSLLQKSFSKSPNIAQSALASKNRRQSASKYIKMRHNAPAIKHFLA